MATREQLLSERARIDRELADDAAATLARHLFSEADRIAGEHDLPPVDEITVEFDNVTERADWFPHAWFLTRTGDADVDDTYSEELGAQGQASGAFLNWARAEMDALGHAVPGDLVDHHRTFTRPDNATQVWGDKALPFSASQRITLRKAGTDGPAVTAFVEAMDSDVSSRSFDAAPWLATLSDDELAYLVDDDFLPNELTDQAASTDPDAAATVAALERTGQRYAVRFDVDESLAWIRANRPGVVGVEPEGDTDGPWNDPNWDDLDEDTKSELARDHEVNQPTGTETSTDGADSIRTHLEQAHEYGNFGPSDTDAVLRELHDWDHATGLVTAEHDHPADSPLLPHDTDIWAGQPPAINARRRKRIIRAIALIAGCSDHVASRAVDSGDLTHTSDDPDTVGDVRHATVHMAAGITTARDVAALVRALGSDVTIQRGSVITIAGLTVRDVDWSTATRADGTTIPTGLEAKPTNALKVARTLAELAGTAD